MKKVVGIICCFALIGLAFGAEKVATVVRSGLLSLQVDSYGHPHLGYVQIGTGQWLVTHAVRDGGWVKEVVDSSSTLGGDNAPNVSLAIDQNDEPGMTYGTPRAGGQLCYAHKVGTSWQVDDLVQTAPSWPTLQYFLGAMPYIAYVRDLTSDKKLIIGKPGASGWEWDSTAIDYNIDSQDKALDFCFDKNNHAQFVYIYYLLNEHKLARWTAWSGTFWTGKVPIDSTGTKPNEYGVHMAKSPNGNVGAVYAHQDSTTTEPYQILFTTNNGSGWLAPILVVDEALLKTVAQGLNSGPALAFDTLNRPHVFYLAGKSKAWELWHAWREGSIWKKEMLVTIGSSYVGRIECALDGQNRIHLAYTAGENALDLFYYGPGATGVTETRRTKVNPFLSVSSLNANGVVRFNLPGVAQAGVSIYDAAGMLVATVEIKNGAGLWNARPAAAGAYFARVQGGPVQGSPATAVKFIKL